MVPYVEFSYAACPVEIASFFSTDEYMESVDQATDYWVPFLSPFFSGSNPLSVSECGIIAGCERGSDFSYPHLMNLIQAETLN